MGKAIACPTSADLVGGDDFDGGCVAEDVEEGGVKCDEGVEGGVCKSWAGGEDGDRGWQYELDQRWQVRDCRHGEVGWDARTSVGVRKQTTRDAMLCIYFRYLWVN